MGEMDIEEDRVRRRQDDIWRIGQEVREGRERSRDGDADLWLFAKKALIFGGTFRAINY